LQIGNLPQGPRSSHQKPVAPRSRDAAKPGEMVRNVVVMGAALAVLSACMAPAGPDAPATGATPVMMWDQRPDAVDWTSATLVALQDHDAVLAQSVPADIGLWCPGYASATLDDRRAFWVGLMSAVAKYESGWNPQAMGGAGRYVGMMQISPRSANFHGCTADTADALKDATANLTCAAEMVASGVARDGVVAGPGSLGAGRNWMPFRDAQKRAAMAEWTAAQPWCQGGGVSPSRRASAPPSRSDRG
jgi:hypothetical protein